MKLYPLTHPQRRIWDAERSHPGTSMWNNAGTLKIRGKLDFDLLDKAIQLFIASNDSIRIRIHIEDGVPYQYVAPYHPSYIERIDFSHQGVKGLYEWDVRQTQAPMPLHDSPLFYIALAKTAPDEGYVYAKLHHIISDGVSFVLFANEIMENYDRLLGGLEPETVKRTSYLEYVTEEQAYLDSPRYAYDEAYWLALFAGYPEPTVLKQRTASYMDTRSRRKACVLSTELSHALQEFCDKNRISPFCLLLAAFSVYLNRVTGKRDLVMSAPVSNRTFAGASERFGMYVNTVPLRIGIDDEAPFMDLLESVSEQWFSMLKHQRYPYDVLVEKVHAASRDSEPLYDLALSYQIGTFVKDQRHFSYEGRWHFSGHQTMSLAVHLNDRESSGRFILDYDYQTQLFTAKSVDFVHEHLCNIIEDVIAHPQRRLGALHMLSDAEYIKVVSSFNGIDEDDPDGGRRAAPDATDLVSLWKARVTTEPEAEATRFHGRSWSNRELDMASDRLDARLVDVGVKPGDIVALLLPRSDSYVAAMLAVLKVGAAFMPVDAALPAERVAYMMRESQARFAIGDDDARLPQGVICIGVEGDAARDMVFSPINPSMLAYIIYTSGSTGVPKGVMIEHHSIAHFATMMRDVWGRTPGGRMLFAGPTCFDLSVMEVCIGLLGGRTLVIADDREADYPERLATLMVDEHVDLIMVTPGRMQLLLASSRAEEALRGLHEIGLGADTLSPTLLKSIREKTLAHVTNFYGPTEATIAATACDLTDSLEVTIGRPLPDVHVYILDVHGNPVPISVPGELYIGGAGVSRGYIARDELTAERFMTSPFVEGERLYRTGDLARWYPRGEIALLGRIDQQVKIRGYRIELGEIGNRLRDVPGVEDATVTCFGEEGGRRYLCGYVVGAAAPDVSSLKDELAKTLPFYMIPSYIFHMDALPLTVNGKVDAKALPHPADLMGADAEQPDSEGSGGSETLSGDVEKRLASLWSTILEIPVTHREAHFLELGGDSLSMVRMVSQVSETFDVELRLEDVYAQPTLAHCAQLIEEARKSFMKPVRPVGRRRSYPATPTQQRMYAVTRRDPTTLSYNIPCAFTFTHRLDDGRLRKVLCKLIERHEVLRTSLIASGDRVVQKVAKDFDVPFSVIEGPECARRDLVAGAVRPFDIGDAPLMRLVLIRTPETDTLLFDFHHAVCDQRTFEVILEDFSALYAGDELPTPAVDYKDCAVWYEEYLKSPAVESSRSYWCDKLDRAIPPLELPTKGRRTGRGKGAMKTMHLDASKVETLQGFVRDERSTTFPAILLAYALVLSREAGQDRLVVGAPVVGRINSAMQRVVGAFVNTVPLVCDLSDEMSVEECFQQTARTLAEALAHQDLPFERIVAGSGVRREVGRNPLFDAMLVVGKGEPTLLLDGQTADAQVVPTDTSKLDVTLYVQETSTGFDLRLEYDTDLFAAVAASRMLKRIAHAIEVLYADPRMALGKVMVLPPDEYELVTDTFQQTDVDLPTVYPQERLAELAAKRPHDIAVVGADARLDFRELKRRVDVVTHSLLTAGATKGAVVGVMLHRTSNLLAVLFGVMASGAAWLPIDPSLPSERRKFMMRDGGVSLLVLDDATSTAPRIQTVDASGGLGEAIAIPLAGVADSAVLADSAAPTAAPAASAPATAAAAPAAAAPAAAVLASAPAAPTPSPDDAAYLIYTSGSTGAPKASVLPWRGVVNLLGALDTTVGYDPTWTCVSITTISFDIFIADAIVPLCDGCRLIMADEETARQPALLAKLIEEEHVDFLQATPSRMQVLIRDRAFREAAARLKVVLLAGEKPLLPLIRQLKRLLPQTRLLNGYGPSEVTVYTSFQDLRASDHVSIGRPIANTHVYILDGSDRPVPVGSLGEACISGPGVSVGYRGRPELNETRFSSDPFRPGLSLYRSGDLCSFTEKGEILIHGRTDQQVKIHGLRIEPGEVELALMSLPGIDEAVVEAFGEGEHRFLCAFFVSDAQKDERDLRRALLSSLPSYMVPSRFVRLDVLPVSSNGKVDRSALPMPGDPSASAEAGSAAGSYGKARPSTRVGDPDQRRFLKAVSKVLGVKTPLPDDDFFDLGGDSLLIIAIQARMFEQGFSLRTQDFYDEGTLEAIFSRAQRVGQKRGTDAVASTSVATTVKAASAQSPRTRTGWTQKAVGDARSRNRENRNATAIETVNLQPLPLDRVLVTGATGFLGAHIVEALRKAGAGSIVCLVRASDDAAATDRLASTLNRYAIDASGLRDAAGLRGAAILCDAAGHRDVYPHPTSTIEVLSGDVQAIEERIGSLADVTTVIHAAALTEHVGRRQDFEMANIVGTRHVVDLALRIGCPLVHVSTLSVAGSASTVGGPAFSEGSYDCGQEILSNEYVRSKFLGEGAVLDAIREGLDARIVRMGNLTGRWRDGVFQDDVHRNAFAMRLLAMVRLGCYPDDGQVEFDMTPVDSAAEAVMRIIGTQIPDAHRIFHLRGEHDLTIRKLSVLLEQAGYPLLAVPADEFRRRALESMVDNASNVFGVIRDIAENGTGVALETASVSSGVTDGILADNGFRWPEISAGYLEAYLQQIMKGGVV